MEGVRRRQAAARVLWRAWNRVERRRMEDEEEKEDEDEEKGKEEKKMKNEEA